MAGSHAILLKFKPCFVLTRKSDFSAVEHNHPACLKPDQKKRQRRKSSINGTRIRSADLKVNVDPLHRLISDPRHQSSRQSRTKLNLAVGQKNIKVGKQAGKNNVRKNFKPRKNDRAEDAEDGHFLRGHLDL